MTDGFNLGAEKRALKIPAVFWKIIFDPVKNEALVFIVFNSPCPWDTALLNKLRERNSKCTRGNCIQIMRHYKMGDRWNIKNENYDALGLVFCCEAVVYMYSIFQNDATLNNGINEVNLLPDRVQRAKLVLPSTSNNERKRPAGG